MAALPVQGNCKSTRGPGSHRGVPSPSPESSLTWCLSHLSKPVQSMEERRKCTGESGGGKEADKRSKAAQWRALVAIRTQHIKGGSAGISRFRTQGGLKPLLDLLKHPECSRKTLDLALSILANCCTELATRVEVRKLDGISIVVDILKRNVATDTVQNRAARALGNLAMDPQNSAHIHSSGGVPLLLLCLSLCSSSSSPTVAPPTPSCHQLECAQSAARALFYLADTPSNRLSLIIQGALSALAALIAPEHPQGLRRAALRTLHELTRGCGIECAKDVSRSGVLSQLGAMASSEEGKPFEELALKSLANLCSQGCLRPLVGSLGVIRRFAEEVKKEPLKSVVFLKALCLCCKEAVNRAKVKECGGLETLVGFLAAHQSHPLSRMVVVACVDFVYDEAALEQLQEQGLVPLLVGRLVALAKEEMPAAGKTDVGLNSCTSPTELLPASCFESFDFPAPEGNRREEATKDQVPGSSSFLSLRSWLLSEGLISSEGDLLESPGAAEADWSTLHLPSPSPPQTSLTPCSNSQSTPQSSSPSSSSSSTRQAVGPASCSSSARPQSSSLGDQPVASPDVPPPSPRLPPPATSTAAPRLQLGGPSPLSSPAPQTPASPTKFSSPMRKRPRVHLPPRSAPVPVDAPPSLSQVQAHHRHPYHPEPWAPESPLLLLLSRFSHAADPSAALVNSAVVPGLLSYLTRHRDPSSRCFRILCRLSCNPNCLHALLRTGSLALIRHLLCRPAEGRAERGGRQTGRVRAKVKQLGLALLNNVRVQCESAFGSGVVAHTMLSGSESDKMNCALSLPLINSNKALLKKLLLDNGGLLLALQPLSCNMEDGEEDHTVECARLLPNCFYSPPLVATSQLHSLYFSLLIGCLSTLVGGTKAELEKKNLSPLGTFSAGEAAKGSPPPLKKPRLDDLCSYHDTNFDVIFQLTDGTALSANNDAVSGGAGEGGSEYFRALLRGGFEEAKGGAGRAIPIKDVSGGMLLPVLHYLHGCRLAGHTEAEEGGSASRGRTGGQCHMLGSLARDGLGIIPGRTERLPAGRLAFQNTPLGEAMIGASRFLVAELQREVEELCVDLLLAYASGTAARSDPPPPPPMEDDWEATVANRDQGSPHEESADEGLARHASGLELSGGVKEKSENVLEEQSENPVSTALGCMDNTRPATSRAVRALKMDVIPTKELQSLPSSVSDSESSGMWAADKTRLGPKNWERDSRRSLKSAARNHSYSTSTSSEAGSEGWTLWALLPQMYWFSQRYSYPALGRACLSVLLGCNRSPRPPFRLYSSPGDCLARLAKEADCTETLKQDLLDLAKLALS